MQTAVPVLVLGAVVGVGVGAIVGRGVHGDAGVFAGKDEDEDEDEDEGEGGPARSWQCYSRALRC